MVPEKSLGTSIANIWYRKKVWEPVSEKFDTGTDFRRQNLGILRIYNGYRSRIGSSIGNFSFFLVVSEQVSEKFGTGKSFRSSISKIWYRKKVLELVSEKFGTEKSTSIGIKKKLYRKKNIVYHFGYCDTLILAGLYIILGKYWFE